MIIVSDKTGPTEVEDCRFGKRKMDRSRERADAREEREGPEKDETRARTPRIVRKVTVVRNRTNESSSRSTDGRSGKTEEVKRFEGDGLSVKMDTNNRELLVTGDGCNVTLGRNSGRVRVVGDGCRLRVLHNLGYIEYEGDGGRVLLGPDSARERVSYVGDGGKVSVERKKTSPEDEKGEKPEKSEERTISRDRDGRKSTRKARNAATTTTATTTTTTTTTTITTLKNGKKSVEKWFVDPTSVIRSLGGLNLKIQ